MPRLSFRRMTRFRLTMYSTLRTFGTTMPNRHHFLVDLEPFGLDNPNEIFFAADRPYGLIEGTILRDDLPPAEEAW